MPKKKTKNMEVVLPSAEVANQLITDTIRENYMPYVMSVIVSRAIPEIDGFKPSHRKLLYTMYKMGLLTGARTKSANVVGQTMRLNPHGDASIYETLVRLTRGNEALLHPFIDSKGSFGKQYSRDMAYAAPRYTECKLDPFCAEIFRGIDKNAVDMVPNYDNTMQEPALLPTTFPNILVSPNLGIAVGMASNICSFNLAEICDGTIALLKNPRTDIEKLLDIIKAPDFSGGGFLIYDREQMRKIYETGHGSVRLRSRYQYDKSEGCIEILQIPYSTSLEIIIKRISDLVKEGKVKEIIDLRDEIDLNGFKLALDVRRGTDPDALMAKLFKLTTLEDEFSCNFNVLIGGSPRQLGLIDIIKEWILFRMQCIRREFTYDLNKKKDRLHLLLGLGKILLDIDKAIRIVRETKVDAEVVPNLMEGFGIDKIQAEYIAEIKLRNLNREYIINSIKEIENLQKEIAELEDIIGDDIKIKDYIAKQLAEIKKKYGKPRKTQLIYTDDIVEYKEEDTLENYNVRVLLTKEGYFKKITLLSLRGNDEQRLKDGDMIICEEDAENKDEIIFFTDKARVYKAKIDDFESVKASVLGDFLAAKIDMESDERPIMMKVIKEDYSPEHNVVIVFENGKGLRVPMSAYETKSNRRRITSAYSEQSPVVGIFYESEPFDLLLVNNQRKAITIKTSMIPQKTTRTAAGVNLFTLKKDQIVTEALRADSGKYENPEKYNKKKIPAVGILLSESNIEEQQISMI